MDEIWKVIRDFPEYEVSSHGHIRSRRSSGNSGILALSKTQYGLVQVGLMREGVQYHRSVPLLVAKAFLPVKKEPFNTPINLDGNRNNNRVDNLVWRPRWFAIRYNQQFRYPYPNPIKAPIMDIKTREISRDSFYCATRYGLLESDLVVSILNHTYVWPTYQEFVLV